MLSVVLIRLLLRSSADMIATANANAGTNANAHSNAHAYAHRPRGGLGGNWRQLETIWRPGEATRGHGSPRLPANSGCG
eukprot:8927537-Pyramimonas_sp.AAC.1